MTDDPLAAAPPLRRRRPPRRRRGRTVAAALVTGLVCFGAGVAVGQALEDGDPGTSTATFSRTLVPATVAPPPGATTGATTGTTTAR